LAAKNPAGGWQGLQEKILDARPDEHRPAEGQNH